MVGHTVQYMKYMVDVIFMKITQFIFLKKEVKSRLSCKITKWYLIILNSLLIKQKDLIG